MRWEEEEEKEETKITEQALVEMEAGQAALAQQLAAALGQLGLS